MQLWLRGNASEQRVNKYEMIFMKWCKKEEA